MWIIFLFMFIPAFAVNVWHDEVRPMLIEAGRPQHLMILGGGVAGAWIASPFDGKIGRGFRVIFNLDPLYQCRLPNLIKGFDGANAGSDDRSLTDSMSV